MQIVGYVMRKRGDERLQESVELLFNSLAWTTEQELFHVCEDDYEELKHLKAWTTSLAKVFNSLQGGQYDLYAVELNSYLSSLWNDLNQFGKSVPEGFEILNTIRTLYRKV